MESRMYGRDLKKKRRIKKSNLKFVNLCNQLSRQCDDAAVINVIR